LKKHRRFEGRPLVRSLQQPSWQATGYVSGDIKDFVARYRRTYSATNPLSLTVHEVRILSRKRQEEDEVIRVLNNQRSLAGCQANYKRDAEASSRSREGA